MTVAEGLTGGSTLEHAVELAPRVWWVGSVLPGDEFQCHVYLVENGTDSALIDPGSPLTVTETLRKVEEIVPLAHVHWLVCHHADPDVAAALPALRQLITRDDARVVTEWRAEALLRHYDAGFPFYRVEEHDWRLELGGGRTLGFQLTPYLHFPGALVSHDSASNVLFSADIFGGFVIDPEQLVATDADGAFDVVRLFHQHYMPSRELLSAGLRRVRRRFPQISLIAPQHGSVIPGPLVDEMFERLDRLECGIFQLADNDLDLNRLLRLAEARERLLEALLGGRTVDAVVTGLIANLAGLVAVEDVELYLQLDGDEWLRIDRRTGTHGESVGPPGSGPRPRRFSLPIPGEPAAQLVLRLAAAAAVDDEVAGLLEELAPSLRTMADNVLRTRSQDEDRRRLRRESERDPLTGVLNRRGLERRLPDRDYAVVLIDLDHFKRVNDTYGHDAGDRVLRGVARATTGTLREGELLARIGGEEFVAVLPGTGVDVAASIAARLIGTIEEWTSFYAVTRKPITASAGVSVADPVTDDPSQRFNAALVGADEALYRAKEAGRNRVRVHGEQA